MLFLPSDLPFKKSSTSEALEHIDQLERKKRRARQHIDDIEEEYEGKRKIILDGIKRKLVQEVSNTPLFTIYWKIR